MARKSLGFRDFLVRLAFVNCVLDLATRELRRDGMLVHLPPKAYTLLDALLRERPRVLTRSELDELLWPRSYVARSSLGRLIAELRAAIGDDAREPHIVRTTHGVGYAFCAEVVVLSEGAGQSAAMALLWGGRWFLLEEGEHLVGRDPGCRILVDVPGVSRHHARIRVAPDRVVLEDLGSKNGTYVNRRRVDASVVLEHGDEVSLGTAVLAVRRMSERGTTQTVMLE
jgi:DNA-binding winged helix-turn-helix (wHTH) protein